MRADGALQPPFPAIGVVHTKDDRALETPSFTQRSPGRFLRQEEEPPRSMGYSGRFSGSNGASSAKLEISRTRNGRLVEETAGHSVEAMPPERIHTCGSPCVGASSWLRLHFITSSTTGNWPALHKAARTRMLAGVYRRRVVGSRRRGPFASSACVWRGVDLGDASELKPARWNEHGSAELLSTTVCLCDSWARSPGNRARRNRCPANGPSRVLSVLHGPVAAPV
jgi:hypothetical protein